MYTQDLTCTHTVLHMHTYPFMDTHSLICTHQPYMFKHIYGGQGGDKIYKLQSLLTLQIIFSQGTTSGMFHQTKDLEESCLDKLTYIFHPLVIIKWKTDLPIPQTRGVHCDLSHQAPLTLRSEEGSTGPSPL